MVNYSRKKEEKSLEMRNRLLPVKKKKACLISLFFLALLPAIFTGPIHAFGMDKVAVLPFKINTTEPAGNLGTSLQGIFSQYMGKMGYQAINTELINGILGDDISFSELEKKIIPFGKANDAKWIIMGEVTEKDESIQLNVKVLDPDSAKTPFSIMMIEKDRKNLPESMKKIAESLSSQIKNNIVISDIKVKGSKRADEEAILNIIESQKGDQFDQEKLDRDLRTIYKMGFFEDVNYDISDGPAGKIITFNLDEKPTIIQIVYEGNKFKKDDKLSEELGIKKYSVLNRNEVRQSVNRLLEFYRNDGYYNVEIKPQIKTLQDENEVILTYVIKEGEKVYITKIQFKGNKVFDSDDLQDLMLTKEKGWLTWFTDSGVLDKKKLELHDLQKLKIFYDNHGYITAQIGDPVITYDKKEEGLTVTIPIVEGDQYMVNDVIIEGELLRPAAELRKLIDIKKGDPFSRQVIYTEKDKISNLYADLGYAYADVSFQQPRHIEGTNLVDAVLQIKKNKRVRIERINIYGNEITKDKVIRRELKLIEGDYFSGIKLEKSKENITRLDLYKDPEIKTRKGSSDDLMVIDIDGEEQLRRSISFSAGYGGYEGFMFQTQYSNNNMFGRGQNLSLNALLGGTTTQFSVSFTEPWLFDKPVRGSIALYDSTYDYDAYTRGTINYSYDKSKFISYSTSEQIAGETGGVTSSVTLGIERNSKDKWWDTTKGSLNYFTYEYAGGFLGGDNAYNKYLFGSTIYLPVVGKTVFVIDTELGYVQKRSGGKLPIYEKFILGGIDSVRGYEYGSISPLDRYGYELGGTMKWLYKLEWRFPISKGQQGMTALVFFDAGNAFSKQQTICNEVTGYCVDRKMRWNDGAGKSVGFGLRWYSPMGPIRLEYGYKLKENRKDPDSGRFEFKMSGSY